MKLTHRRLKVGETAAFRRTCGKGILYYVPYVPDKNNDKTSEVVNSMAYERSWKDRLRKQNSGKEVDTFIEELVKKDSLGDEPTKTEDVQVDLPIKEIEKKLTKFGKQFKATGTRTLQKLLEPPYTKDTKQELIKINELIQKSIEKQKSNFEKSIANNVIPFDAENLNPSTDRIKWLYTFLDDLLRADNKNRVFEGLWQQYKFSELKNIMDKAMKNLPANTPSYKKDEAMTDAMYGAVLLYHKEHRKKRFVNGSENKYYNFILFLDEVMAHFKQYKQKKSKGSDPAHLKKWFCSEPYVKSCVRGSILNQLTAALVQQGKLLHYSDVGKYPEWLNSDGLSYIQVEEAFKKQLMSSITWANSRLKYLFDYNGTEDILLQYNKGVAKKIKEKYLSENATEKFGDLADAVKDAYTNAAKEAAEAKIKPIDVFLHDLLCGDSAHNATKQKN